MPSNNWNSGNNAPPPAQQQGGGWGGNRQQQQHGQQRPAQQRPASSDPFANMDRALEQDRVGYAEPPEDNGGSFGDPQSLPAGRHEGLLVYVDGIVRWHFGTVVSLKVWAPGKPFCFTEIGWNQTPPSSVAADPNSPGMRFFRKRLVDAYTAGGWPEETWTKSAQDPKAIVPPYYRFFVQQVRDGSWLPALLQADIEVGKYTNILAVRQVDGPVQAPMPRRVPEFIADAYRWPYQPDEFTTSSGHRISVAKLNKDTFPTGHLGLRNYKDHRP